MGGPELTWWGPNPIQWLRAALLRGPSCAYRGPVPSGFDGVVSENATLTAPRDTPGVVLRAVKGSRIGIVPSYRSKGYP
jgi:hypothetical protein